MDRYIPYVLIYHSLLYISDLPSEEAYATVNMKGSSWDFLTESLFKL